MDGWPGGMFPSGSGQRNLRRESEQLCRFPPDSYGQTVSGNRAAKERVASLSERVAANVFVPIFSVMFIADFAAALASDVPFPLN
jgi:hypothetical protein